ncbi:MAG: N-acetylmuramoyl-L-alanine amidase [Fibrobacterales bacterium]
MLLSSIKQLFLFILILSSTSLTAGTVIQTADTTAQGFSFRDTTFNGLPYFSSEALLHTDNFTAQKWFPFKEKLALKSETGILQLTHNSRFLLFGDDSLIVVDEPPLYVNDQLWLPLSIVPSINPFLRNQLSFINDSTLTFAGGKGLLSLNVIEKSNGTLVELQFARSYNFDKWFHAPHYILRFIGLDINPELWKRSFSKGLIKKIIPVKESELAQLTFEMRPNLDEIELLKSNDNKKLRILFRKKNQVKSTPVKKVPKRKIKNIIIDAGHGGRDPGAQGLRYNEKDISLKVAKKLEKILKKKGYNPILTRKKDVYLTLKQRPEFATKHEGDMFISLHCNAIGGTPRKKQRVRGFKMYILRAAKSEDDKAIARRENAAIEEVSHGSKKEITPVEWILLEHQLNLFTKESEQLAGHLVESFSDHQSGVRKMGYGAGQAGFYVLVGAFMPAVLIEMGFISNPKEEVYMGSESGSSDLAESIYKAIHQYKNEIENL